MIDMKTATAKEISRYFSHEVNNLLFKPDKIAEEQKESEDMKDLDICWIKILSSNTYMTDLRNERSAQVGKKLAEIPFVKKMMELVHNEKMEAVAKEMAKEHRSLQQSFTTLTFYHYLLFCNKKEHDALIGIMGEYFYRLPLI